MAFKLALWVMFNNNAVRHSDLGIVKCRSWGSGTRSLSYLWVQVGIKWLGTEKLFVQDKTAVMWGNLLVQYPALWDKIILQNTYYL